MKVSKIEARDNEMNRRAMDQPIVSSMVLVVLESIVTRDELRELATVRWHKPQHRTGIERVSCNLWIHAPGLHTRGTGSAGGCGYCKRSAAAAVAFRHAGIELATDDGRGVHMDGAGMSTVREALEAIARHFGYSVFHVVES